MLRILWCGFGLGVSVLIIVLMTLFVPILPSLVAWHDPKGLLALFLVGGLLVGLIVYPTFAFAAYVRSVRSITSPYYWIFVGGLVALISNLFLAVIFLPFTNFIPLNSSIPAGLVGGFVYSLFHDKATLPIIAADLKSGFVKMMASFRSYIAEPTLSAATA